MAAIGKVSIELEAKIAKLETDVGRAARIMEREFAKMRTQVSGHLQGIEKRADETGKVLKRVFNIGVAVQLAHDLRMLADNFANLSARVKLASGANANFGASLGAVKRVAMDTYASLTATAGLVQKISQSLQNTGMSASNSFSNAIKLTETFNKALVVSGAGTIQAEAAMLQFSQAIAKGKLDGDEFRSVMENNSRFMLLLADSLGVTFKELYKMREEGKLTNDMIMKVTESTAKLDAEFASFPITIGRAFTNLNSALTTFVGGMDTASGASRSLAQSINFVAKNIDEIAAVAIGGGAIYAMAKGFDLIAASATKAFLATELFVAERAAYAEGAQRALADAEATAIVTKAKQAQAEATYQAIAARRAESVEAMKQAAAAIESAKVSVAAADAEVLALGRVAIAQGEALQAQLARTNAARGGAIDNSVRKLEQEVIKATAASDALKAAQMKQIVAQDALNSRMIAGSLAATSLAGADARLAKSTMAMAGSQTAALVATLSLSGAQASLVRTTSALAAVAAVAKTAWTGFMGLIGGWPTLIAAAAYGTYLWINRETEVQAAAAKSTDALDRLRSANNKLDMARAKSDVNAAYLEQVSLYRKLLDESVQATEKASVAQDGYAKATGAATFGLQNSVLASTMATAEASRLEEEVSAAAKAMMDTATSAEHLGGVKMADMWYEVRNAINAANDPLELFNNLVGMVGDNYVAGSSSADEFIADLDKQTEKLRENNAELRGGVAAVLALKVAELDWNKLGDKTKDSIREKIALVISLTNEGKALSSQNKANSSAEKSAAAAAKEHAEQLKNSAKAVLDLKEKIMDLQADGFGSIAKIEQEAAEKAMDFADALVEAGGDTKLLTAYMAALIKKKEQDIAATEAQIAAELKKRNVLGQLRDAYKQEEDTFGLRGRALFMQTELQALLNQANQQGTEVTDAMRSETLALAGAHYDAGQAAQNQLQIMEEYEDTMIDIGHSVADAFGNMFSDILKGNEDITQSFENLGDALVDIIADSVGQMISEFFKLQIINPMLNQMFSGFGGNLLPTAAGLIGGGNQGGLAGLGGNVGSWAGQAGSTGGGVMSSASSMFGSIFGSEGAIARGVGSLASGIGALARQTGSSILGALSGGLGQLAAVAGPIAAVVAAAGLVNSLTGGRLFGTSYQASSSTSTLALGDSGGTASASIRESRQRSLFRGRQTRNRNVDPGADAIQAAQDLYDSVREVMIESARALRGDAPAMLESAMRTVVEYDKQGKVKATKYFVDILGRTWEEATAEAATQRIAAESMIATIDAILGTTIAAASETAATGSGDVIESAAAGATDAIDRAGSSIFDNIIKTAGAAQGEASAIAERWRDDAETLMDGATFLLLAAQDIRDGAGLLGEGSLTQIADLIEELQVSGESLSEAYTRVALGTALLEEALDLSGVTLDLTREAFVRFAADIAESAGGIERAQALWSAYFDTFYTDGERAARSAGVARTNATREFGDIGMDVKPFLGEGGVAAFRAMFEELLPTLSADAIVQWLEAASALGILIDATAALADVAEVTAASTREALSEFMADIESQIADLSPPVTFAERLQVINQEMASLVVAAIELGASEAEIARIRALGQLRINALLDEQNELLAQQAEAALSLRELIGTLAAESAMSGISPLTQSLMSLRAEYQQHIDRINELAIASGRAGASQEELAVAAGWYASQLKKIASELMQSGLSLVQRLYGATGATSGTSTGSGSGGGDAGGVSDVADAVEDRYKREMELLKNLGEYLDSLGLSSLSPLTPQEQLQEAQQQYQDLLARAMGGDLDALGQLQGAANTYLGQAQSYYGGVGAYGGIFDGVQAQIQALLDRGPLNSPAEAPPTVVTGPGGGGITVEPGQGFADLSVAERAAIAGELATVLHDLIALTGQSLIEVSSQLGLDLRDLVRDLGVNLDDLTVATTVQLADISRQLGVDLTELASGVSISLGTLADEQSLLNDALEQTINGLPAEFRDRLQGYLTAIEDATTEADANAAIAEAEAAINLLPADIRDLLAPYFEGVSSPTDDLLDYAIQQLAVLSSSRDLLADILAVLGSIDGRLVPGGSLGNPGVGPFPPGPDAIAAAAMSVIAATVDEASAESDVVGNAKPSDMLEALRAIKEELASVKAAVTGSGNKTAENVGRVESAVKNLNVGKRNG